MADPRTTSNGAFSVSLAVKDLQASKRYLPLVSLILLEAVTLSEDTRTKCMTMTTMKGFRGFRVMQIDARVYVYDANGIRSCIRSPTSLSSQA